MASLHDLHRALFPTARPVGADELADERARARSAGSGSCSPACRRSRPSRPAISVIIPGPAAVVARPAHRRARREPRRGPASRPCSSSRRDRRRRPGRLGVPTSRPDRLTSVGRPRALERSVIGFLVNRRAELDRRAAELEAQLARFALGPRPGRPGRHDRRVPRPGRRHRGTDRRPARDPRPGRRPSAAAAVARYLARPSASAALRVGIAAPAGDPGAGGRLRPPRRRGTQRARADRRRARRRLLGVELARDAAVRQARDETPPRRAAAGGRTAVGRAPGQPGRRRRPGRPRRPRSDPRRPALLMSPRRLVLRGSSESLELRVVAAARPTTRMGWPPPAPGAFLGRTVAVSRPFAEPGARPAAEAAARATLEAASLLPSRRRSRRADACRPICCSAACATCRTGSARRASCSPRSSSVGPRSSGAAGHVARPCSARPRWRGGHAAGVHRNTVAYRVGRLEALAELGPERPGSAPRPRARRSISAICTRLRPVGRLNRNLRRCYCRRTDVEPRASLCAMHPSRDTEETH